MKDMWRWREEKGKEYVHKIVLRVKKNLHDMRDYKEESQIKKWWGSMLVEKPSGDYWRRKALTHQS